MPSKPLKRTPPKNFETPGQSILLQSPMQDHFRGFIIENAKAASARVVVRENTHTGKHVVICGAGPSLRDEAAKYCTPDVHVWGCNSALTWLVANGLPVTHGFAIDQTSEMLEEWHTTPDVEYIVATTVHPHLVQLLELRNRSVRFFHNYVGIKERPVGMTLCQACDAQSDHGLKRCPACGSRNVKTELLDYEDFLYQHLYPGTIRAGSGLNAVTRAIDVAIFMGYETVTVIGADCCLRVTKPLPDGVQPGSPEHKRWLTEDVEMHADGGHALASRATMVTMDGEIDGRVWTSKPDMLISAVFLTQMEQKYKGRLRLIGDTLPVALRGKDKAFLRRLPTLIDGNGKALTFA